MYTKFIYKTLKIIIICMCVCMCMPVINWGWEMCRYFPQVSKELRNAKKKNGKSRRWEIGIYIRDSLSSAFKINFHFNSMSLRIHFSRKHVRVHRNTACKLHSGDTLSHRLSARSRIFSLRGRLNLINLRRDPGNSFLDARR